MAALEPSKEKPSKKKPSLRIVIHGRKNISSNFQSGTEEQKIWILCMIH